MSTEDLKKAVGEAALQYIERGMVVGVGTGSTVNHFIDALARSDIKIRGAVSSSEATSERLRQAGIKVFDLNEVNDIPVYIDGADEANELLQLIKGGGGALTREKIVAANADQFVCIADHTKYVRVLGKFPLPVEVIPMARSYVARELFKMGGRPTYRQGVVTDNGNVILDVHDLQIAEPIKLERAINDIPGVVTNGLFAIRPADVLLLGGPDGVKTLRRQTAR